MLGSKLMGKRRAQMALLGNQFGNVFSLLAMFRKKKWFMISFQFKVKVIGPTGSLLSQNVKCPELSRNVWMVFSAPR